MEDKIYIRKLPCYQKATEKQLLIVGKRNTFFDLKKLPEALQEEMRSFIEERGKKISIVSLMRELFPYNVLCKFLNQKESTLKSFQEKKEEELIKELRGWLLSQNYLIIYQSIRRDSNRKSSSQSAMICYLRKIIRFTKLEDKREEKEKDIWEIEKLGIKEIKENVIVKVKTFNFTSIIQPQIKQEIKDTIFLQLKINSILTIRKEIKSIKEFTKYLAKKFPDIQSCTQINRKIIEEYILYIKTEKTNIRDIIIHLKMILEEVGKMTETPKLEELFLLTDLPRSTRRIYKTYSDEEIARLNSQIIKMDEQIARALIVHQLLGTRISDTLTLETDCIYKKGEQYVIKIYQPKTNRHYEKPINEEIAKLVEKSIAYTKERYGKTKYVFTSPKDRNRPFQYSMVQYKVRAMIKQKNLRDDNGELFGFDTHRFRYTYARKLTEMHLDDYTISKLLGHANISSVRYYRKMGDKALEKETRAMRQHMDEILSEIVKGWKEYEQV